jgi:hypothetical protein
VLSYDQLQFGPPWSTFSTPEEPQYPDQATSISAGSTAAATHVHKEDVQVKAQLIPVFKESSTEPITEHPRPEPLEPPMQSRAEADYQDGLPQKQHSSLMRLKKAENSSLSGSMSSFGSLASVYSEAGGKGDYDITGEVLVGVHYKDNQLHIHVERARGLAAANHNGYSNPYVKTYLLPDKAKHTKQKTSVKKKTLDPVYNEKLTVRYV